MSFALAVAGDSGAQPSASWRFWDSSDGFIEAYTSSVALNGNGTVWVRHGAGNPMELLDGYAAAHFPEPGGPGKIEAAPDGTVWTFADGQIKRYRDLRWTSWRSDEIAGLGTLRINAFQSSDITYSNPPFLQGTVHLAALDRSHALILLPDRILEFDASTGAAKHVLDLAQTQLQRFVSVSGGTDGTQIVAGRGGLGRLRRSKEAGWQWETLPRPPDRFVEFDYPSQTDGRMLFLTGITSSAATAALCFDGNRWSEIYRGDSRNLRVWPGADGTAWVQDGNHLFEIYGPSANAGQRRTVVPRTEALSGILLAVTPEGRGRFWVASSEGVAHYMPALWRTPPDAPKIDDVVNAITEDKRGRVWFLSAHALLCLDESGTSRSRWSSYPLPEGETAWAVFTEGLGVLPDGRIAIRTTSPHLLVFDPVAGSFRTVRHPGKSTLRLMVSEPEGKILVEVYDSNSSHARIETFDGYRFQPFIEAEKLGGKSDNRTLSLGPRGEIWTGSNSSFGVWRNGRFTLIGDADGVGDAGIFYVYRDPQGTMFAGGRDGFYRLDGGRWRKLQSGLDRVRNVVAARDGTLWVSSGTGIHRYRGGNWISNGTAEGLPSNVVYRVFEDSRGRTWAGTTGGLSLFHPGADTDAPLVTLAEDQNPKETPPGGKVHLLFSGTDKWKFTPPGRLLFSWRIDRGRWSPFSSSGSASFESLPAGHHRFEVRAMDRNGNISLAAAVHNFAVMLPWYATPQFRWLAVCALAVIFALLGVASVNYWQRGRLIVELNRKNKLERDRQKILQMIAGRQPLSEILQEIAVRVAGHSPGSTCVVVLENRAATGSGESSAALFSHPVLPESALSEIGRVAAGRPFSAAVWRDSLHRVMAHSSPAGCEAVSFDADGSQMSGVIALYSPGPGDMPDDTRWLLETFGGLAAGAVENAHLYHQLDHQARHDVLTGLPNRLYFEEHLEKLVGCGADSLPAISALLYIDLDRFKQINDTLGHRVGDLFLRQVAARFSGSLSEGTRMFRIGGDEFIVIIEELSDRDRVERLASNLLSSLQLPVRIEGHDLFASASIGVSFYPVDGQTPSALQKNADVAMYRAKGRGPNRIEFYSAGMASNTEAALEIEQILRKTLEKGLFELYYQPQFTASGRIAGFEALVRLPRPERDTIGPDLFIPIAENTGLIVPVGRWVLREACRQTREWLDEGLPLTRICVNISALELARPSFAAEVETILASIPLPPSLLEIELTESAIIGNVAESTRQMKKLRSLGVRLAIDDFGTGYSSLSYLQTLPIDALKIDRTFVQAVTSPHDKYPLVQAIIALGRNMGLEIIAEGIETDAQLSALSASGGCDYLQGYLLGRPQPACEARELLRQRIRTTAAYLPALIAACEVQDHADARPVLEGV